MNAKTTSAKTVRAVCPRVRPGETWEQIIKREKPVFDATLQAAVKMPGREHQSLLTAIRKQVGRCRGSSDGATWWVRICIAAEELPLWEMDIARTIRVALYEHMRDEQATIYAAYQYGIHVGEARAKGEKPGPYPAK